MRLKPDGMHTVVAGIDTGGDRTNLPHPLPALLYQARSIVRLGSRLFAVATGHGIYTLVLP